MLLSTTPLSKIRPLNPEQDSLVKTKLFIESMNRSPAKRSDFILIRVVHGGDRSPQLEKFQTAFSSFSDKFNENVTIKIEYIGPKEIGKSRWMPSELIDWLLESNIHFIITHINQGRSSHGLIWCMKDMLDQVNRLYYHAGFPNGQQLMCAVFTQNKGVYINKLNEGSHSIPTLTIDLNKEHVYDLATLER